MRSSNQLSNTKELETACLFVMSCLKEFAGDDMNAAERARQSVPVGGVLVKSGVSPALETLPQSVNDLLQFDRLLILGLKAEAVEFGEDIIRKRYADKNITLDFPACYAASSKQREDDISLLMSHLKDADLANDAASKLSDYALAFAEADARHLLLHLMDDLPSKIFGIMKKLMGELFFKSLHFGAVDNIELLLLRLLDVNELDTNHRSGAVHPLNLVLLDFARFCANIDNLFDEQQSNPSTHTETYKLVAFIEKRLRSYQSIVNMLLEAGADVDATPNKHMQGTRSPRALSLRIERKITKCIVRLGDDLDAPLKKTIMRQYLSFLSTIANYLDKRTTLSGNTAVMFAGKDATKVHAPQLRHFGGYI